MPHHPTWWPRQFILTPRRAVCEGSDEIILQSKHEARHSVRSKTWVTVIGSIKVWAIIMCYLHDCISFPTDTLAWRTFSGLIQVISPRTTETSPSSDWISVIVASPWERTDTLAWHSWLWWSTFSHALLVHILWLACSAQSDQSKEATCKGPLFWRRSLY